MSIDLCDTGSSWRLLGLVPQASLLDLLCDTYFLSFVSYLMKRHHTMTLKPKRKITITKSAFMINALTADLEPSSIADGSV